MPKHAMLGKNKEKREADEQNLSRYSMCAVTG